MAEQPGRTRRKLAQLLQRSLPTHGDITLTWLWRPELLFPATGAYRTKGIDCWSWEGIAVHVDGDGREHTVLMVGSWYTMTELLRHERLQLQFKDEIWLRDQFTVKPAVVVQCASHAGR